MVRLEAVLDSWRSIRADTAQAWLDMPEAEAAFQPTADLLSYRDLAIHVLNAGRGMARMLEFGERDFSAPGFRERMREHYLDAAPLNREQLAERLRTALAEDLDRLAALPADFYSTMMTRFDGTPVTRLEICNTPRSTSSPIARRCSFICGSRASCRPPRGGGSQKNNRARKRTALAIAPESCIKKFCGTVSQARPGRLAGAGRFWRTHMVTCPNCDSDIDVEEDELDEGDVLTCDECGATLNVLGLDPLEIEAEDDDSVGGDDEDDDDDDEEFLDEDEEDEDGEDEEDEDEDEDW